MKRIVLGLMILVVAMLPCVACELSSHGKAFKDFDVDEDSRVTFGDVGKVFKHTDEKVQLYKVSKYDIDLDGNITFKDVVIAFDNAMDGKSEYKIDFGVTKLQVANRTIYILYVPRDELDEFVAWYNHYTPINYHTWSAAGYKGLPQPTPYFYVCIDFATDAYWVANKNFLNAKNDIFAPDVVLIGFPVAVAWYKGHAYNAILVGDNISDLNNWVIFEPQVGKVFTWDEIRSNDTLQQYYYDDKLDALFEWYEDGKEYTLEIFVTENKTEVDVYDIHASTLFAITRGDTKTGVELDHEAAPYVSKPIVFGDNEHELVSKVLEYYRNLKPLKMRLV